MRELLGGKGANVAEMTRVLGEDLVPPGFTITTEACVSYFQAGRDPEGLWHEVTAALERLQQRAGRRFGDDQDPLLVSVRSGARESMPGMLDTILNLGLNDRSVTGLAAMTGNAWFAWDSYRRLVQMFGNVVHGVPGGAFEERTVEVRETEEVPVVDRTTRVAEEVVVRKEETQRTETVRDTERREEVEITDQDGRRSRER